MRLPLQEQRIFLLVLYGYGDRMELETAGADCIVADVNELKVKLNNI